MANRLPNIDFGNLTEDDCAKIAIAALDECSTDKRVEIVKQVFASADERDELIAQLEEDA